MHRFSLAFALTITLLVGCASTLPQSQEPPKAPLTAQKSLDEELTRIITNNPEFKGMSISVYDGKNNSSFNSHVGLADSQGRTFDGDTPARTASVTKMYVAATVLKLAENGKLSLRDSVQSSIPPEYNQLLESDGYDTSKITIENLLAHTSGFPNHADLAYIERISNNPSHIWTRQQQLQLMVDEHDPLFLPGEQFAYSDSNYVLLGHIIERASGKTLASAVRDSLKFENLELGSTWWERVETPKSESMQRARQYLDGQDVTNWDASIDLFGGGGLMSSSNDLAKLTRFLLSGELFGDTKTLEIMKAGAGNFTDQYRFGLFPLSLGGQAAFNHSGFWGVYVIYLPERDLAISGIALEKSGFKTMKELIHELVQSGLLN